MQTASWSTKPRASGGLEVADTILRNTNFFMFHKCSWKFLEKQFDLCLQISLFLHSINSYTLFSEQVGFCSLLIWRGSRVKFWPTLYSKGDSREKLEQPKEGQLHSRNNSCSLSTGNKTGTLGARCLFWTSENFFPELETTLTGFQENFTRVL